MVDPWILSNLLLTNDFLELSVARNQLRTIAEFDHHINFVELDNNGLKHLLYLSAVVQGYNYPKEKLELISEKRKARINAAKKLKNDYTSLLQLVVQLYNISVENCHRKQNPIISDRD